VIADQARMRRDFAALPHRVRCWPSCACWSPTAVTCRPTEAADRPAGRAAGRGRSRAGACGAGHRKGSLLLLCGWQTQARSAAAASSSLPAGCANAACARRRRWRRPRWPPPSSRPSGCPLRTCPQGSSASWPARCWTGTSASTTSTRSDRPVASAPAGQAPHQPAWHRVLLAAEFLVAVGTWPAPPAPTTWPPPPGWRRFRGFGPPQRRPAPTQRYHRILLRVCDLSALISAQRPGLSRDYYQRKRREGRTRPGHACPGPASGQRAVGAAARQPTLHPAPPAEPAAA
jgi:hypothetical protein